ncbi:MAG: alpha/beta fold hydrolase [Gammaproteobacteria bacterium]|nr:alpha/beta fold hydrolase [Gammaproteobacteria bacterium]MCP5418041.1 alpha/beta fold hydrolase [Chromatiaceae bacterium]
MVIYLHGFSSGAASNKAATFRQALPEIPFLILDYPAHQPHAAVTFITHQITQAKSSYPDQALVLMGSSMGGFYARFLAAALDVVDRVVLINPALEPEKTLKSYIGLNRNMVTGEPFEFSQQDFDDMADYLIGPSSPTRPTLVLLDEGDEVIDYRVAAGIYEREGKVVCYPGGSHRFEHIEAALLEIRHFLGIQTPLISRER